MLKKIKTFLITSILGGVTVILPIALIIMVFGWVFTKFSDLLAPITNFLIKIAPIPDVVADLIVMAVIIVGCFFIGFLEKTKLGAYLLNQFEKYILRPIPGYNLVKETILQLIGSGKNPFSHVALVRLFNNDVLVTGFITDEHDNGMLTVFVPTGPNPTTGGIFHVPKELVQRIDAPIETAMKSVISCGHGSKNMLKHHLPN